MAPLKSVGWLIFVAPLYSALLASHLSLLLFMASKAVNPKICLLVGMLMLMVVVTVPQPKIILLSTGLHLLILKCLTNLSKLPQTLRHLISCSIKLSALKNAHKMTVLLFNAWSLTIWLLLLLVPTKIARPRTKLVPGSVTTLSKPWTLSVYPTLKPTSAKTICKLLRTLSSPAFMAKLLQDGLSTLSKHGKFSLLAHWSVSFLVTCTFSLSVRLVVPLSGFHSPSLFLLSLV